MKNLKTVLLLLFPLSIFSQKILENNQLPTTRVVEIYRYVNNTRDIVPTKIIEVSKEETKIYNVNFGIKEVTPNEVIIKNKVFEVNNGIQNLFPKQEIIVPTTITVRDYFNFIF